MSKHLKIADDLSLPIDTVTQTIGILAKRRAGKSYTMRRLTEQLFGAGLQTVIIDPKGDQWGIRSAADGKGPGLPIVILGGERGDAPLEPNGGEVVAKLVVEERVSVLLDISLFRKHEVATFATGFLENLYRLKAREIYRTPMMLVIDEADAIAPQKPQKGEERMLGAAEDIVRRGGQRGIGCTLVTQRSAVLNKNVLTQVQIMIALRTIAPQDLAAMNAWIDVHGTPEQKQMLMDSLPSLPVGDAWFWSPGWPTNDGIFKRVHVLPIETFDSGATPKPGEKPVEPKKAADVDLEAFKRQMAATIEKAKENDPALLKKQVAQLRAELAKLATIKPQTETKIFEKSVVTDAQVTRIEKTAAALEREGLRRVEHADKLAQSGKDLIDFAKAFLDSLARAANQPMPAAVNHRVVERRQSPAPVRREIPVADATGRDALTGPERKILDAIAWMESIGIAQPEQTAVAFLAGYTYGGGGFNNPRGALNTKGLVEYVGGGLIALTEAGRAVATYPKDELTNERMREKVLSVLPGPEQRILIPLLDAYPNEMSNTDLAVAANYTEGSGGYNNPRGRLRTLGLIEYTRGGVRARDILFPETAGAR